MKVRVETQLTYPCDAETLFDFVASDDGVLAFVGFGPIPGTESTVRESGGHLEVGGVARTTNRDGSTHRETVLEVDRPRRYRLRIDELSSVFRFLVRHAEESFEIAGDEGPVELRRAFEFELRTWLAYPLTMPLVYGAFRAALNRSNLAMRERIAARAG